MSNCKGCGRLLEEKALENERCFHRDPTDKESKEFAVMLRVVEALSGLEDYTQIDRVCAWAANRARNDLEERTILKLAQ